MLRRVSGTRSSLCEASRRVISCLSTSHPSAIAWARCAQVCVGCSHLATLASNTHSRPHACSSRSFCSARPTRPQQQGCTGSLGNDSRTLNGALLPVGRPTMARRCSVRFDWSGVPKVLFRPADHHQPHHARINPNRYPAQSYLLVDSTNPLPGVSTWFRYVNFAPRRKGRPRWQRAVALLLSLPRQNRFLFDD